MLSQPRILIFGPNGVGKSSFAVSAPEPVAIDIEDGLRALDVPTFGVRRTFAEVAEAIQALRDEDHSFRTVVVDTVDALEPLIWMQTCRRNNWRDIETPGFGRGYLATLEDWRFILDRLDALRDRGMTVILVGHAEIKRFDSPETEPYDRYQPKLHARASALIQERMDAVLFANYRVSIAKADVGFNKRVARGVGNGDRVLYATERPSAVAKNRFNMPDLLPLQWEAVAAHIPYFNNTQSDADRIETTGTL